MAVVQRQIEAEKKLLWARKNALQASRPVILCDPEFSWREIIPETSLECVHSLARTGSTVCEKRFSGRENGDDRVVESRFTVGWVYKRTYWGRDASSVHPKPALENLDDLSGLQFQTITVDRDATTEIVHLAREVFDRVLPVKLREQWYWSLGLTRELIKLRGLEQYLRDIRENPKGVHNLMAFLRDGTLDLVTFLENAGLYSLNNEGDYIGSGGFGWTSELPTRDYQGTARAKDLWLCSRPGHEGAFARAVRRFVLSIRTRDGALRSGVLRLLRTDLGALASAERHSNIRRVSVCRLQPRENGRGAGEPYVYSCSPIRDSFGVRLRRRGRAQRCARHP
jgi:hypothetical protein